MGTHLVCIRYLVLAYHGQSVVQGVSFFYTKMISKGVGKSREEKSRISECSISAWSQRLSTFDLNKVLDAENATREKTLFFGETA